MANKDLPPLFAPMARSFWASVLLTASVLLNMAGVDLFATLGDMGLGNSSAEVMATGDVIAGALQDLAPIGFGLWAWLERRAPSRRLTLWPPSVGIDLVGPGSGALIVLLALGLGFAPGSAKAQAQCGPVAEVLAGLSDRYGEFVLWEGSGGGRSFTITVKPDGTTWTALLLQPDGLACLLASGGSWRAGPAPQAAGEDG